MLDREFIVSNRELVEKSATAKKCKVNFEHLFKVINRRKELINSLNSLREEKNKNSSQVSKTRKDGGDISPLLEKGKEISNKIKEEEEELKRIEEEEFNLLKWIPNILDEEVPSGENSNFKIVKEFGKFEEKKLSYFEIIKSDEGIDFKRGAKISGSHFPLYLGKAAYLERVLVNFMLDLHIVKHNYKEIFPPFLVNYDSLFSTGQLPKLEEDMYRLKDDDLFLIPTAEVPVTNIFRDEILNENELPKKFVAYSACFRREAGSYGKDTKGLKRLHQFNKVELVRFTKPEESKKAHLEMLEEAQRVLVLLGLSYRVILLPDFDTSFSSSKTYDIEVWAEGSKEFLEVSSVSNFLDFQARRGKIRYKSREGKNLFIHTLNGSGLATPRTVIALIEKYQTDDGFDFPPILKDYIKFGREIFKSL
ncbi:TPA: serine--tRNA ligase [candidate division WOR-3]|uniref:Serine--tRNA ligase n=2 Tax=Bacteria candidate phyla TaxID=1783234 RepID=A0A101I2E4_UNCT6|nr:MAG: Serine--tRNA ligase [candidate division TA06 bacterium 34_109]HAF08180.1 serine--tRNA ligase [candidate division WOR-3 bacterium]HCP16742.1 serine--tRNA ligase [candidate division WOR-3 bacterium]